MWILLNCLADVFSVAQRLVGVALGLFAYPTRTVRAKETVLVVLDPLEAYRYTFGDDLLPLRRLIWSAKMTGVPVVYTRLIRTKGSVDDSVDAKGHWTQFVASGCEPFLDELDDGDFGLSTTYADAFAPVHPSQPTTEYGDTDITSLEALLKERRATTLVIAGTWAESCVERTAYSACTKGYTPVVVHPAVGGHWVNPTLAWMDRVYAHVVGAVVFETD